MLQQRLQGLHLVYDLREDRLLYQRFPGVERRFYVVAGLGLRITCTRAA